jgi:hypothetical protein
LLPPTQIFSHRDEVCEAARRYLIGLDSLLAADSNPLEPPAWLRTRYKWGPVKYPVYWCQVVEADELDCGSLSAIAREVYESRGVIVTPVQMILEFPSYVVEHWAAAWQRKGLRADWIWGRYVYHEAVGVVCDERRMKVYDPIENAWIEPSGHVERGRVVAIRVVGSSTRGYMYWEDVCIELGKWHRLSGIEEAERVRGRENPVALRAYQGPRSCRLTYYHGSYHSSIKASFRREPSA